MGRIGVEKGQGADELRLGVEQGGKPGKGRGAALPLHPVDAGQQVLLADQGFDLWLQGGKGLHLGRRQAEPAADGDHGNPAPRRQAQSGTELGDDEFGAHQADEPVPGGDDGMDTVAVAETHDDEDIGEGGRGRHAARARRLPRGRLDDGETILAQQERRLHHIAQGEDGTMAAGAQLAGDGQQRHHVAEAAAHFPSHQNLGHGPIPGCRRRRRVAPFDRSWRQSAPAAYPSGLREDVAAAKH